MTKGIIYYNCATKVMVRLLVSLWTLRNWAGYDGPVTILYEEHIDRKSKERVLLADWFKREAKRLGADLVPIPHDQNVEYPLVQKSRLWRWSPYDCSLFIDGDTLVKQNPAHLLDDLETGPGFAVTKFVDWVTTGSKISRRIESWRCICGDKITDDATAYGTAVNTGVFGWRKGHPLLEPWEKICVDGHEMQKRPPYMPLNRTLDEVACQMLVAQYDHTLWDAKWNWSIQYGIEPLDDIGICHYHGGKHLLEDPEHRAETLAMCDEWRKAFWQLRNSSPDYDEFAVRRGDRNTTRYEISPKVRHDLTILCATDATYANKIERHMEVWMDTPGLREQRYLLMCIDGIPYTGEFARMNRWKNVEQVHYKTIEGGERREKALSAFIFGAAEHVKTKYHMKLDGDAKCSGPFIWPEYKGQVCVCPGWGGTRNKGAPHLKRHFLNELDAFWEAKTGEPPIFPEIPVDARYKHPRIRSYVCIQLTSYIQKIARECAPRLPIPSHDGLLWYYMEREGVPNSRFRFTDFIKA